MKTTEQSAPEQLAEATDPIEIAVDLSITGISKGVVLLDEATGDKYRITVDSGTLKLTLLA